MTGPGVPVTENRVVPKLFHTNERNVPRHGYVLRRGFVGGVLVFPLIVEPRLVAFFLWLCEAEDPHVVHDQPGWQSGAVLNSCQLDGTVSVVHLKLEVWVWVLRLHVLPAENIDALARRRAAVWGADDHRALVVVINDIVERCPEEWLGIRLSGVDVRLHVAIDHDQNIHAILTGLEYSPVAGHGDRRICEIPDSDLVYPLVPGKLCNKRNHPLSDVRNL